MLKGGDNVSIKQAGLPDITGKILYNLFAAKTGDVHSIPSGSFLNSITPPAPYTYTGSGQSAAIGANTLDFKASNSNAIYGASSAVQPPAIVLIPQLKF